MRSATASAPASHRTAASSRRERHSPHRRSPADGPRPRVAGAARRLGGYLNEAGLARELVALPRPDRSVLVLDCVAGTSADARLLAHLTAQEPAENARLIADMYLADETRGAARRLSDGELTAVEMLEAPPCAEPLVPPPGCLLDADGVAYRIGEVPTRGVVRELRWTRTTITDAQDGWEALTLRDVIGALEDYEPARTITSRALAGAEGDGRLSTVCLRAEAARLERSPIVLNRGLREAVHRALAGGLSLSEIAMRCGRVKFDARGNRSGESSWLSRRIGDMPEGGGTRPTPWVHSDTLALIATHGLGVCPHEVEL